MCSWTQNKHWASTTSVQQFLWLRSHLTSCAWSSQSRLTNKTLFHRKKTSTEGSLLLRLVGSQQPSRKKQLTAPSCVLTVQQIPEEITKWRFQTQSVSMAENTVLLLTHKSISERLQGKYLAFKEMKEFPFNTFSIILSL